MGWCASRWGSRISKTFSTIWKRGWRRYKKLFATDLHGLKAQPSYLFFRGDGFGDPFQIVGRSVFYIQTNAFRDFVGVEFRNCVADLNEGRGGCLDHQKPFPSFVHVALPSVDRRNLGHDVDAGGETALDEMAGDFVRFFFRPGGGEDDSFVGHIKSALSCQLSAFSQNPIAERVALEAR